MEQRLLSADEAAVYLGLPSRHSVYRLISSGRLPAVRLGKMIRLDLRDLDAMIETAKAVGPLRVRDLARRNTMRAVPRQLAPLRRRDRRRPGKAPEVLKREEPER